MSIDGIRSPLTSPLAGTTLTRADAEPEAARARTGAHPAPAAAITRAAIELPNAGADAVRSAEAPADTDPQLWAILTSAERDHFATLGARGPLTYGYAARPQAAQSAAIARGGRLDVKA